ncbi:MAG: 3-deoxy-7-phosphoheptulonate synthase [Deltaproteobacteria bacterium]|nr:3-deoxy-7-phosphoheptulonate synthase [Deltaproteobacteria bacterium]
MVSQLLRGTDRLHSLRWSPFSWHDFPVTQVPHYHDGLALQKVLSTIRQYPPLVFVGEVEALKKQLADATYGKRFVLQGGDCAESFRDCKAEVISAKLKILLQMATVLCYGLQKPVVCIGRMAGQYSKPRSVDFEWVNGQQLPVFRGESINSIDPTLFGRTPDPFRLLTCYHSSAMTLNFIRSLATGGFADFHHPEQWELGIFRETPHYKMYQALTKNIARAVGFMTSLGAMTQDARRMTVFTSHEGLHLNLEEALTHFVSERGQYYNLGAHMLWIGDRTRQLDGAHAEYFRGIANPIGIKIGPSANPEEILALIGMLNPENEAGRITLITRLGTENVSDCLPPLIQSIRKAKRIVLWSCDPMHGNSFKAKDGIKTRKFSDILSEMMESVRIHQDQGSFLGGVHFEMTGEAVTECLGGLVNLGEKDLVKNYTSFCDPRLNYHQSLEVAFTLSSLFQENWV